MTITIMNNNTAFPKCKNSKPVIPFRLFIFASTAAFLHFLPVDRELIGYDRMPKVCPSSVMLTRIKVAITLWEKFPPNKSAKMEIRPKTMALTRRIADS